MLRERRHRPGRAWRRRCPGVLRKTGKQRLYGRDARGLRPVHEWTGGFERFWRERFDGLDAYVQDVKLASQEA